MANRTEDLLARITDADLRAALEEDFRQVSGDRKFGLVFERHLPESVRLPGTPIRRGSTAVLRSEKGNENQLRVMRVSRGVATCLPYEDTSVDETPAPVEHPVSDLVAVARFGEPVFPGLEHVGTAIGPDAVDDDHAHLVIEGENFHALQALEYTHAGKVDLIYIDPPYNTGNKDWIYNDNYVGDEDAFRHSKWLSFMERRLILARELLAPDGMIYVSIDDNEQHRLRMLMDQVFGETSFHAVLTWKKRHVPINIGSARHRIQSKLEYVLAYSRCPRDKHPGFNTEGGAEYVYPYRDSEGEYRTTGLAKSNKGVGRRDNLIFPILGVNPAAGMQWQIGSDKAHALISANRLRLIDGVPRVIVYRHEEAGTAVRTFWSHLDESVGTAGDGKKTLKGALGADHGFDTVKPTGLIQELVGRERRRDAVVLDFFAGSGSTGEAVLRLNAEDGGTRKFILVTNNELNAKDDAKLRKQGLGPGDPEYDQLGVFQHVTWPRLRTVLTGTRPDGSNYSDGLPGRIEAFKLTYQDPDQVADHHAFKAVSPLLWMMAGTAGNHLDSVGPRGWAASGNHVVITDPARAAEALSSVGAGGLVPEITTVFTVTDSDSEFASVTAMLPSTVESVRLYSHYLGQFLVNRAN